MDDHGWPEWSCPRHAEPMVVDGPALVCPQGDEFVIKDGIPRFVEGATYADAFGAQWKRYRRTQLDSYTGRSITATRTRQCLGEELWHGLKDKLVLECGCGAGRFTEVLLERGARVTSIDLSNAVEANQENCPQDDHHRVAAADISALPFVPRRYDIVFCLGVLQHTPIPEVTIAHLYDQVKPGGWLVIDHYAYNLSRFTKTDILFRAYLRRVSPEDGLRITEQIVRTLMPVHEKTGNSRLAHLMLSRLSPVAYYGHTYPELDAKLLYEWALLDTHDGLTDRYKHLRTRGQILGVLQSMGLVDVHCEYGGNGVEARGRRP